ncbi:hypothetical protein [Paenibacillus taichungensis]
MTDRGNREAEIVQELVNNIAQYQERMGPSLSALAEQSSIVQKQIELAFSNEDVRAAIKNAQAVSKANRNNIKKLIESNEFKNAFKNAEIIRNSLGPAILALVNSIDFDSLKAMASYVSTTDFPTQKLETSNVSENVSLATENDNETYEKNNPLTMLAVFVQTNLGVILDPKKDRGKLFVLFFLIILVSFGKPQLDKAIENTLFPDSSEETLEVSKQLLEETKRHNLIMEEKTDRLIELQEEFSFELGKQKEDATKKD